MTPDHPVPAIDSLRCSGCGRCVAACPERLFSLETTNNRKTAVLLGPERCTHCGACLTACPLGALTIPPFSP